MDRVRDAAVRVLERAERERIFVEDALAPARAELADRRDRALLTALVFGATRHRLTLDAMAALASGRRAIEPRLRGIVRVGLYQLIYLSRVPPHAAVDTAVEQAKRASPAAARFVNAVLRATLRGFGGPQQLPRPGLPPLALRRAPWKDDPIDRLAIAYSHPKWLMRRWRGHGWSLERIETICAADNEPPAITIAPNADVDLEALLRAEGIEVTRRPSGLAALTSMGDLTRLDDFRRGLFRVQDEVAARAAPLLSPQPGEAVADLCSAPGGKTAHLAHLLGDRGRIISVDVDLERMRLVRRSAAAFPDRVRLVVADGRRPPLRRGFDAVLVDVPCSNTGVLGRRADARWRLRPEHIGRILSLQDALLAAAARLVRPGGRVVYSTCSLEPEENEGRIEAFLTWRSDFEARERVAMDPEEGHGGGFAQLLVRKP